MNSMLRSYLLILAAMVSFCVGGCSESNPAAPATGQVHQDNWINLHGVEALADLARCTVCHGTNFSGSGAAVGCYSCHLDGPPFAIHPREWGDVRTGHQNFASDYSWTSCAAANCHGATLEGGVHGPSCFDSSATCHVATTHPPAPHATAYADPLLHGAAAKAGQHVCQHCHGRPLQNFEGGFVADLFSDPARAEINNNGRCSICHSDAKAHPTFWQGGNDPNLTYAASHRRVDSNAVTRGCALCHLTTGPGTSPIPAAPSCFSPGFSNSGSSTTICHANGPLTAPHPVDGSFRAASAHGKEAKQDLMFCQGCHATPSISGAGSNPRFNLDIGDLLGGCESCHDPYYAHPAAWAGPNSTFHYSAGNINGACKLCHGSALDGVGGVSAGGTTPGGNCRGCHAETVTFALDCTSCHGYPPTGSAEPVVGGSAVNHNNLANAANASVATVAQHDQCALCHGVKSSSTAVNGAHSPNANYRLFDFGNDVNGDHWNGAINLNGPTPTVGTGYNQTDFGCDNAACHANDALHRLSDSALPVAFADYGRGSAPHALDGSYRLAANHGVDARADLTNCKACHGQSVATNPRYNLGITSQGGKGCEGCHNDRTAHPAPGVRENLHWYDVNYRHSNGARASFAAACGQCHPGIGGTGTVGPACSSCHNASPITYSNNCVSCHSLPPNGSNGVAGTNRPNRSGAHSKDAHRSGISSTPLNTCAVCHGSSFGPGNVNHFDATTNANVSMTGVGSGIVISQSGGNTSCAGTCHGKNHGSASDWNNAKKWY